MAETYTTKEGDTVDLIAWQERGQTAGVTEQILDLNPGLASVGPVLPFGLTITLPDPAPKKTVRKVARIWGYDS